MYKKIKRNNSTTRDVILALIPYTKQNILLTFKPNQFFNELEKTSDSSANSLKHTFNRMKRENIIFIDKNIIVLSLKARQIVQPFIARTIPNNAQLMVIFDIPEDHANLRQKFRNLLRQLKFKQIQQSVWSTNMDHGAIIFESINELNITNWVQLYEASRIKK
jgi:FPC/CPF motif-containing protein YcgG